MRCDINQNVSNMFKSLVILFVYSPIIKSMFALSYTLSTFRVRKVAQ